MERFLKEAEYEEDYYDLLGCDEQSTPEQIATEYKILAKKYHPDKVAEENKIVAEKQFIKIDRAKEVLLDKGMREKYDMWRRGGFKMAVSFRKWLDMQPQVHQSMHWTQPEKQVPKLQDSCIKHLQFSETPPKCNSSQSPTSLTEFRRGSRESNHLTQFRSYGM